MKINTYLLAESRIRLPISQNYFLASTIYNVLSAQPDYSRFLHDHGYCHEPSGRMFKLFVFSPLRCRDRKIVGADILLGPGKITWSISSPMPEFLNALAEGLLSQGTIDICSSRLMIESVEAEPDPVFCPEMRFTCLSPIVVSRSAGLGEYAEFLLHDDPEFSVRVRANLIRKYELIYGHEPADDSFEMCFDPDYLARKDGKVTKLIDIRGTKIRGVLAPFTAYGSVDLFRIGTETGFGERGSMGFGCVEAKNAGSF